jgi:dolichyl-phosphate-mannose--protein O-mannosyl transferase
MITHNARMIKHNANILAPHPWQTTWWEWVFCLRGLAYYGRDEPHGYHANVYLLGNPVIIWAAVAAVAAAVVICIVYLRYRRAAHPAADVHAFAGQASFCLLGYALNLLPYLGVARSTFVYHYMPALAFATILVARVYEQLTPLAYRAAVFKALVAAAAAVFVHFAPWVYALPVLPEAHDRRRWLPRWT